MVINGEDIINMSKAIISEYDELVEQQLKSYADKINELSKEVDNTEDIDKKLELVDIMIKTCDEMDETRKEMYTNPEYIMKFTLAKIMGRA